MINKEELTDMKILQELQNWTTEELIDYILNSLTEKQKEEFNDNCTN